MCSASEHTLYVWHSPHPHVWQEVPQVAEWAKQAKFWDESKWIWGPYPTLINANGKSFFFYIFETENCTQEEQRRKTHHDRKKVSTMDKVDPVDFIILGENARQHFKNATFSLALIQVGTCYAMEAESTRYIRTGPLEKEQPKCESHTFLKDLGQPLPQ